MVRTLPVSDIAKTDARFRHVAFGDAGKPSQKIKSRKIDIVTGSKFSKRIKLDDNASNFSELVIKARENSQSSVLIESYASANRFLYVDVYCEEAANINLVAYLSGTAVNHIEINVHLSGIQSKAEVGLICLPKLKGSAVVHSLQNHDSTNTMSNLECRAVLADETRIHYHGLITVSKNGSGTDAYQKNSNVLLSGYAKAYSVPKLEIEANDVRCTHGSTTAGLSNDDLFYVQSRGLSDVLAKRMIAKAFLAPVVGRLNDKKLESDLGKLIEQNVLDIIK